MSQQELLKRVINILTAAEIPYMLTGSLVSSLQGEPRSTHDMDVVVSLGRQSAIALLEEFPESEFYFDPDRVLEAVEQRGMFNLISKEGADKVDFWLLTGDPFDQARFQRRQTVQVLGLALVVSSPEDTILAKLNWARLSGGSEKQFQDALRVYETQISHLDLQYLEGWAEKLGIEDLLTRVRKSAEH